LEGRLVKQTLGYLLAQKAKIKDIAHFKKLVWDLEMFENFLLWPLKIQLLYDWKTPVAELINNHERLFNLISVLFSNPANVTYITTDPDKHQAFFFSSKS